MSRIGTTTRNFICIGCGRLKGCRFDENMMGSNSCLRKTFIFFDLVHFVKGVKNRYMYLTANAKNSM